MNERFRPRRAAGHEEIYGHVGVEALKLVRAFHRVHSAGAGAAAHRHHVFWRAHLAVYLLDLGHERRSYGAGNEDHVRVAVIIHQAAAEALPVEARAGGGLHFLPAAGKADMVNPEGFGHAARALAGRGLW